MEMKQHQNQDRRLKTPMTQQADNNNIIINNNNQNHDQQQQQKCPRCESLNTKFCYYNNYSLSQPRYFCKTCRRYWTQGGTLRNVPVGGGCRKGKRMKTSSSSGENSRLSLGGVTNVNTNATVIQNLNTTSAAASASLVVDRADLASSSSTFNYPGSGGFLNSLAAIQSLSNQVVPPQTFPLNPLRGFGGTGTSNLNLLHGFNAIAAPNSFGPPPQQQRSFYQQNWHQSFLSGDNNNLTIPDTALWSTSTSTTTANNNSSSSSNNNNNVASFPMNPSDHQWHEHHLPGYGPPP